MNLRLIPILWQCRRHLTIGLWCDRILITRGWKVKIVRELPYPGQLFWDNVVSTSMYEFNANLMIIGGKPTKSKYGRLWTVQKLPGVYKVPTL